MCFICHDHNISSFRKAVKGLLKFLHGCKDDSICFSTVQQFFQMHTALSMNWLLTQKIFTFCKLPIQLVIQIITIGNDYDGWAV